MSRLVRITTAVVFYVTAANLSAHPHLWVDYRVFPQVSGEALESIRVEWYFDEFFSSSLIMDMDTSKDRVFQADEVAYIRDNAFSHLIDDEYFAEVRVDGKKLRIREAADFNTRIENGTVVYAFSLPVDRQMRKISHLDVTFFDVGYYISFAPSSEQRETPAFEHFITRQDVDTLGWGEVSVPSLTWSKR